MDALVTVASLQQQLALITEEKRKFYATLDCLNMPDIENGVKASQLQQRQLPPSKVMKPRSLPPEFVTLHIPTRGCSQNSENLGPAKPEADEFCSPRANVTAEIMIHYLPGVTATEISTAAKKTEVKASSARSQQDHNFSLNSKKNTICAKQSNSGPSASSLRRKRSLPGSSVKSLESASKPSFEGESCRSKENTHQQHVITPVDRTVDGNLGGPSSKKRRVSLPLPLQIENLRIAADKFHVGGNFAEAAHKYILAINLCGPWTERSMHASLHFNYAICRVRQEQFEEAIKHATEAVKLEPTFAEAHYTVGYAAGKLGKDLPLSMRSFKQVLTLKPNIRIKLPNGTMFGSKEHPLLPETNFLVVYQRHSCAHLKLPPQWTTRESRSQPGKIFFENLQTRETTWILPVEKKKNYCSLGDILATSSVRPCKKKDAAAFLNAHNN